MSASVPEVAASRPENLITAAAAVNDSASALADRIRTQRANLSHLQDGWQGTASNAAVAKAQPTLDRMNQANQALQNLKSALQGGGDQLRQSRNTLLRTVDQLTQQGWQVAPDGTVSVKPGGPLAQIASISPVNEIKVMQLAAADSLAVKTQLANFTTTDSSVGQNIRNAVAGLHDGPRTAGPNGPVPDAPSPPTAEPTIPDDKDPKKLTQWWDSLTPAQRAQLTKDRPEVIGNLNGIPMDVRNAANTTVLRQDLDRLNNAATAHRVPVDELRAHPEKYGLTATDITRYNNAVNVQKAMTNDADNSKNATGKKPDILLIKYQPEAFNGKGAAAIAIGDPDTATNTSVMVSGFTTSVAHGSLNTPDAANLYNEAGKADPGRSMSVVQWMGYDAPDDLAVAEPNMARHGAALLAADVNALGATHQGAPTHLTVIGHSYGSTAVSDAAAAYGMAADDVVLVGSPGTDLAHSAADFHLPPNGHLYVGAASSDPVTHLGSEHAKIPGVGLGNDPAMDGYGSTRFHAESAYWNWGVLTAGDHSHYFAPGSESLFGISDVVSGHGDALEHDGMTAGHRTDMSVLGHLPIPSTGVLVPGLEGGADPESWHVAHNDHHHQ
jgi:uncharacterized protein YukE/pimeloyl-ACP methyl ester carboxylesterase